jgi:nucleoid DNA-binding protein
MNQRRLIKKLARRAEVSEAVAADSLDKLVHQILQKLRSGQPAHVPGLAALVQKADGQVEAVPYSDRNKEGHENS